MNGEHGLAKKEGSDISKDKSLNVNIVSRNLSNQALIYSLTQQIHRIMHVVGHQYVSDQIPTVSRGKELKKFTYRFV